jgi:hypothetical protein
VDIESTGFLPLSILLYLLLPPLGLPIMTPQNTVQDYLRTLDSDAPSLTCPSCGSVLNIRRQGSTEMILTENARLELDGYLASHRRFLEKLEMLLEQRKVYYKPYVGNYPFEREVSHYQGHTGQVEFKPNGIYAGIAAEPVVGRFVQEVDFFQWIENFYSFPGKHADAKQVKAASDLIVQKTQGLVPGLEPRSISGPILNLVFDQAIVSKWCKKINISDNRDILKEILEEVCPAIQDYLEEAIKASNEEGEPKKFNPDLIEGIYRVQLILVILLGHRSEKNTTLLKDLGIGPEVPFTLPRKTAVSPKQLRDLLISEPVLGNPRIGLSQELLKNLKQATNTKPSEASLSEVYGMLKLEIHRFVHFACTGPASDRTPDNLKKSKDTEQKEMIDSNHDPCGWYPKIEPTHSVILLGSPGTGKSSVMLTGFTTFYNNVSALGATVSFDSPEDEARMDQINEDYWAGKMPRPTAKGARTSIKLSLEFPGSDYGRKNFVFTDVAGEVMAQSLTEEGSDPAVLRILKNAETIVFFFDLSIEPSIRQKLLEGDDGTWDIVRKNFERVAESRENRDSDQRSSTILEDTRTKEVAKSREKSDSNQSSKRNKSRASVSQLQLLQKLIKDLRVQYQMETLKEAGLNFICVIPKIDLFADESRGDRYFFTPFIKAMKSQDLLVQSNRITGDDSFSALRSLGGTLVELPEGKEDTNSRGLWPRQQAGNNQNQTNVYRQRQISRWVSDRSLECLKGAGNALGESAVAPIKASLQNSLQVGLIDTLHHAFGKEKVYFLPVSAQGKDSEELDLKNPPNQKLSEYVFFLPVALSTQEVE